MAEQVEGLARLRRKLHDMPVRARAKINKALATSAKQVNQGQESLAQRSRQTGELISGLNYHEVHDLLYVVTSAVFYSVFVEFGTVHVQAQPFFFPPYRILRPSIKKRIKSAVSRAVKEASRVG